MFLDQLIFWADLGLTGAALVVLTVVAMEVGFRLGRRRQKKADESARTQFTAIEGAELTVVGLLLAFTFSMAVSRFETRKQIVVNEANALGTAYLRAQLLPPLERLEAEALLRNYVDTWLELHDAGAGPAETRRRDPEAGRAADPALDAGERGRPAERDLGDHAPAVAGAQ